MSIKEFCGINLKMNSVKNKKTLIFATSNYNKIIEANKLLNSQTSYNIISKKDAGIMDEIPETGKTIEENAIQKANYIYENYKLDCFAEDTGLIIDALNGEPGIYSGRYAGEEKNDKKNIKKVLTNLKNKSNRKAGFKTVIALIMNGELHIFEGIVEGKIINTPRGETGFGYDPIFVPEGFDKTFAELGTDIKNQISHRAKAMKKLVDFLIK